MATTTFLPGTVITRDWCNDVDYLTYTVFGIYNSDASIGADGTILVSDGTNFVEESGATARASLGLTIGTDVEAYDADNAKVVLTMDIADLSADATYYMVMPFAGDVDAIYSVINGAVSSADITVTARIGTTAITDGAITITQSGSAAGDVDSVTPSAAKTVTAGQAINFVVAGGGAGGSPSGQLTVVLTRS